MRGACGPLGNRLWGALSAEIRWVPWTQRRSLAFFPAPRDANVTATAAGTGTGCSAS